MRIIFTILFFGLYAANATNYYVSNSGSDAANGLTTGTAWQHISKVNSSSFSLGDSILFNRGDSWNEQLIPSRNDIHFGAYGTGNKPIITGLKTLTGLTNVGNVWSATATGSISNSSFVYKDQNTVVINGVLGHKARYPNATYLSTNGVAVDNYTTILTSLHGTDYTGGELVTHGYNWIIDANKIASQSGDTMRLADSVTYGSVTNYRYFVQNLASLCDTVNEWAYKASTNSLSIYAPALPTVQYSVIDTLVNVKYNGVTFQNIKFTGGNTFNVYYAGFDSVQILNCSSDFCGKNAFQGYPSSHIIIQNDSIQNTSNTAIRMFGVQNRADSNYIHNTATLAGMGSNGNSTYQAIFGNDSTMIYNKIINTGGSGIEFRGGSAFSGTYSTNMFLKYNLVDTFCYVKDDAGGLSTGNNTAFGSEVRSNIVLHGIGETFIAAGIYLDDNTAGVTVDSNTVSECSQYGMFFHNNNGSISAYDNTAVDSIGVPLSVQAGSGSVNSIFKRNICYSRSASQYCINLNSTIISAEDSSYYLRPISETNKIYAVYGNTAINVLKQWTDSTGFDIHSKGTPTGITTSAGVLYYNPTLVDSTLVLDRNKIDAKGISHSHTVIIHPFQSIILFNALGTGYSRIAGLNFN